ncbi:hypothetical protein [Deinococcus arenicola]|uniref:Uncharacterized protein n=1 Tax=Deinococcus arenicola TaxID=2994950 RepID=A0ABU4DUW3_9DEIO|nr:hypothetical protein [Deinococcus sp. ZS9-10]MDV6376227.1 hypothetical protein [Deinococcus sp. ZS9-10]
MKLISARLVSQSTGQTRNAASKFLKTKNAKIAAHFLDPKRNRKSYLYELNEVKALLEASKIEILQPLGAYEGEFVAGIPRAVQRKDRFEQLVQEAARKIARQIEEEFPTIDPGLIR